MKKILNKDLMAEFSEFITTRTALHFPAERWDDLESKTISVAAVFGFNDVESFIRWLINSPVSREQIEILASYLTIGESYFWREPRVFDALIKHILPELITSRGKSGRLLRIWSAGCSTGEEPFSIAIALNEVISNLQDWCITILATDINPDIIRKAAAGSYGEWSFRNTPDWLKDRYFQRSDGGRMQILPGIMKMVSFSYLNLAEDIYPSHLNNTSAMDIIFCRNVLMYLAPERARQVVLRLYRCLMDGGWLIVSSSELFHNPPPGFSSVNFPGAVVYRKEKTASEELTVFHFNGFFQEKLIPTTELPASEPGSRCSPIQFPDMETTQKDELSAFPEAVYEQVMDLENDNNDISNEQTSNTVIDMIHALADSGRLNDALVLCDKAIEADKLDPALYYLRAVILQEQNSLDEAVISLRHALYLNPDHLLAYFSLGNLALRRGDKKSAKKILDTVLKLANDCPQEEILPGSEGLTAGRFSEIIQATIKAGALS